MLIDFLWSVLNKTPIAIRPQAAGDGQPGQQYYGTYSLESIKGLWTAYGSPVVGGLSKLSSKTGSSDATARTAAYASGAVVNHTGEQERKSAEPVSGPATQ